MFAQYIQLFNSDYILLDFKSKKNMFILQEPRSRTCLVVFAVEVRESLVMGPDQGTEPRTSMCPSLPALRGHSRGCRAPRFSRSPYQPPHSARCLDSSQTTQGGSYLFKSTHNVIFIQSLLPPLLVRAGAAEGRPVASVTHDADPGDLGELSYLYRESLLRLVRASSTCL